MKTRTTPAPQPARETVSFGVRLDADLIDRLDAYAAAHQHKRGWALARAVEAGLNSLGVPGEGGGVAAPEPEVIPGCFGADEAAMVADAVAQRLRPQIGTALFEAGRSAGSGERGERERRVAEAIRVLQNAQRAALTCPPNLGRPTLTTAIEVAVIILAGGPVPAAPRLPTAPAVAGPATDSHRRTLGARLRAARTALHLTPAAAARDARVTRSDYRDAEGDQETREDVAQRLAVWLASIEVE
jgi:hypothetical protein